MKGYCQQSCNTCPGASQSATLQVYKKCKNPNTVAFAWDDGTTQYQQSIIDQFNAAGFKTTFFTTGKLYNCIYNDGAVQSLRNAYASGHQIASHTWSHPDMASLTADQQKAEILKLDDALSKIIGAKPTYFRPPYLSSGTGLRTVLKDLGFHGEVQMNIDTQDWNGFSANQSYDAVVAGIQGADKGGIVLAHEFYNSSANDLLPRVINYAKANGINLVTVAECVGDDVANMYREVGQQGLRDETWVC
ncbi:Carbohydrate esterase 4 protein [Rhizophlyctis rosea]|uniref:Carbohydrate esterase 4 protein n=1 Tax=Rhizophlyctis rosea TaxID=64517 RepID=A0AAD5SED0_9FUNG|nr:Carbohydrate esterase 4 protein [Rhizophlyctis rosea]